MKTLRKSIFASLIALALHFPVYVYSQSNTELGNVVSCSAVQVADWSFTRSKTLGVAGRDGIGHEVGFSGARKKWGTEPFVIDIRGNWLPISGNKETLCGQLDHFGFFPGFWDIDREEDWNNFIIPDDDFKYLITEVQQLFPKAVKSTAKCKPDKSADCIEVEVTVHNRFFENPYFTRNRPPYYPLQKDRPSSILKTQKVCTYGTWIREKVHDDHPELHPSELFWWTAPSPSGTTPFREWWLLSVLDNSNRFNSPDDFDPKLVGVTPWAGSPKTNRFKLAVEIKSGDPPKNFRVKQLENHGVVASTEDTGTSHTLSYKGVPVVSVTEQQATENVGVRFDFCRDDAANRLLGYVELTSRLQADDKGNGGFQVLQVIGDDRSPLTAAPAPTPTQTAVKPVTRFQILEESLKRIEVNGQPRLVGDITAEITEGTETEKGQPLKKLRLITPGKNENLAIEQMVAAYPTSPSAMRLLLQDVPLGLGDPQKRARLEIETPQGKQTFEIKDLALVPEVKRESVLVQSVEAGALNTLLLAAGLGPGGQPSSFPAIEVAKAQTVAVDVAPTYAPLRHDGTPAREDDSFVVSALNESFQKAVRDNDFTGYDRLFKTKVPFRMTTWTFKGVNLTTGQDVVVREVSEDSEAADSNEIRVARGSGPVANGNLKVLFPKQTPGAVYELKMTATMVDANGYAGNFEHRVWSHFIPAAKNETSINALLSVVAQRAGLSYDQLSQLWQSSTDRAFSDAQTRRARIFRTLGLQAVDDEKVTLDELQGLVRAARLANQK